MIQIPDKGMRPEDIFEALESCKSDDLDWKSGKVMGYVYDAGEKANAVINRAYVQYLSENGLDPLTYPSVLKLENELVGMIAELLRGDEETVGNFTSGGTESIMMAVLSARNRARALRPGIAVPEMVLPFTAHAAFYKAAHYLDVKPVPVPVCDETFSADPAAMADAINDNTILLVASAPGYAHGVIDPVEEIAALAAERGLLCHVDGCVGGIHLSYMRKLGMEVPGFDLSTPGVTSLSVDLHKYGYAAKGASLILYKSKDLRRYQIFACARWPGYTVINPTVTSSKTGGPLAAAWAVVKFLGHEGYMRIVDEVMQATRTAVDAIDRIPGLKINGRPHMCMFSFHSTDPRLNVYRLADEMKLRGGWFLQPQFARENSRANLHVSFNYLSVPRAEAMVRDLEAAVGHLLSLPEEKPVDFAAMLGNIELKADDDTFYQLAGMAGLSGHETPERMETINRIMEALPYDVAESLLISFLNNLMVPPHPKP